MRVRIDSDKCQGHGRCYSLAPELFESDEEGYSRMKVTGDVPPANEAAARLAVENCPEHAISIEG